MIWINGKHMKRLTQEPLLECISSGVKKSTETCIYPCLGSSSESQTLGNGLNARGCI